MPARFFEPASVARPKLVDLRERGVVRRTVACDVHELALARQVRPLISARASLERRGVGSVDHHHVEAEARHDDSPERSSGRRPLAEPNGVALDGTSQLGGLRPHRRREGRPVDVHDVPLLDCELTLFPARVERREGVLPQPDSQGPRDESQAAGDAERAGDPDHSRASPGADLGRCSLGGLHRLAG
jgi:hypothetical protein